MTFSVAYNSYTITTTAVQVGKVPFGKEFTRGTFSCEFVIAAANPTAFNTAEATMLAALTARYKALTVLHYTDNGASQTRLSWSHSANTGMNGEPRVDKLGDQFGSACSSRYRFSLSVELPASESSRGGRRSASLTIREDPAERNSLSVQAVYTATPDAGAGAKSAYTNASTNFETYCTTELNSIFGETAANYEQISLEFTPDQENKICQARATYQEVLDYEEDGTLNSSEVVNAVLSYRINWPNRIGASPLAAAGESGDYVGEPLSDGPPPMVSCTYTAQIKDASITGDTYAETLYRETLKPWLLSHMQDALNLSAHPEASVTPITQDETYQWSPSTNAFSGSLTLMVPGTATQVIRYSEAIFQERHLGVTRDKLWDGRANTYSSWSIGETIKARQTITITKLNSRPTEPGLLGGQWRLDAHNRNDTAQYVGDPSYQHASAGTIDAVEYTAQFTRMYTYVAAETSSTAYTEGGGGEAVYETPQSDGGTFQVSVSDGGGTIWASPVGGD